jgi:hypothetical protein
MSNEEADAELQEAWGGAGMSAILLLSRDEAVMSHNYERQHKDAGLPLFRVMGTPEPQDKEAVWPPGILGTTQEACLGWSHGSSGRAHTLRAQGPEFKLQCHTKKKMG